MSRLMERDRMGRTVVHYAALEAAVDGLRTLLAAGASIDEPDGYGNTPLHEAVSTRGGRARRFGCCWRAAPILIGRTGMDTSRGRWPNGSPTTTRVGHPLPTRSAPTSRPAGASGGRAR